MNDFQKLKITIAIAGALALGSGSALAVPVNGANVIVNGDAETGAGNDGSSSDSLYTISGWTQSGPGVVNQVQYGQLAGGLQKSDGMTAGSPGIPGDAGNNYFSGGPDNSLSSIYQFISLAGIESAIDAGQVSFVLSAYLGGYSSQEDNVSLTATFLDFDAAATGSFVIGPVSANQRGNTTGLAEQELAFTIPTLSRGVRVTLTSTRTEGSYNDGYADDLSLVLQGFADAPAPPAPAPTPTPAPAPTPPAPSGPPGNVVPEPDMAALLALGGLGVVATRRRKTKGR